MVDRSRKKRIFLLLLLVLLPGLGMGFLAYQVARNEQMRLRQQWQKIVESHLHDVDEQILARLDEVTKHLAQKMFQLPFQTEDLRGFIQKEPLIKQILVLNPDREQLHPPLNAPISQAESEFLTRIKPIVSEFGNPHAASESPTETSKQFAYVSQQAPDFGFYVWFWQQGLDLIFWQRNTAGLLFAVEIERAALLSDLMNHLPTQASQMESCLFLVGEVGQILYQAGNCQHRKADDPRISIPLTYPLTAFQLTFSQTDEVVPKGILNRANVTLFFSLATVMLALLGMALYLYRDQNRLLREAGQRVQFVNQVSHELKTPLTNIRMYAELLDTELPEQAKKAHEYLRIVVAESQRLSRLIQNVLMFSRTERTPTLHLQKENLSSLVKQVIDDFAPAFKRKEIQVYVSSVAVPLIDLDVDAMKQVIINLFSNVEKYAATGKQVHISVTKDEKAVFLRCQDQGPGIRPELRDKIFEPFFRGSDALTEGVSGTGIGLTLARQLIRLHGGELRLVPTERGACFEIELPISLGAR